MNLLIVDDNRINRDTLINILNNDYNILLATNGIECLEVLNKEKVDCMILDLIMPFYDGFQVLKKIKDNKNLDIPILIICPYDDDTIYEYSLALGAFDFITKPFIPSMVKSRVKHAIMLHSKENKLFDMVCNEMYKREKDKNVLISILAEVVEFRNGESGLHIVHINSMTRIILNKLKYKYSITNDEIELITIASALHDIGKMAIPDEILNKPARLTNEEFDIMKTHTTSGAKMLDNLSHYKNEPLVKCAYDICLYHHERWNGKGYPMGLKENEIPLSAQVVSIADVYDALTSERCYKKAYSHEKAIEMILNNECGVFNPLIIECLLECQDEIKKEINNITTSEQSITEIKNSILREIL